MPWALAATFGLQALGGLQAREEAKAQQRLTKIENKVGKANAAAENRIRKANNELSAATGSLDRARLALSHRQTLRTSGREQEQIRTNLNRAMRDMAQGALEERLDTSFDLGALSAGMAAAGVGGGSKQVLSATIRMAGARRQQALAQAGEEVTYDALKMLTNTQADAYAQLDNTVILDQMDFNVSQFIPQFSRKAPSMMQTLFQAGASTVAANPELTQQTIEGFRSTAPPRAQAYSGGGWAGSATMRL